MNKTKKVALAYSGGLDTSIIIPWLKENYHCDVVAVCGDIGQGDEELAGLEAKARKTGASEVYIEDLREEFVTEYLWHLDCPAAAGEEAGGSGAAHRVRRAGARVHGQRERSGPLRADL
jgi:argininosuccinate synthase